METPTTTELPRFKLNIHPSHDPIENGYNTECRNCWGCSCHAANVLLTRCDRSVLSESYRPGLVEAVANQATRYGEQIRLLEKAGMQEDHERVWKAWEVYRNQLSGTYLRHLARWNYYEAYSNN